MENKENKGALLPEEPARQIQLVMNQPDEDEDTIDLGNVFRNLKAKRRLYAWVLLLCLVVGLCVPLLMYQFSKPMLTVSSVVTLRYEVKPSGSSRSWQVTDLTAPDGTALDLNQITSSYVLQTALDGMTLSVPVTVSELSGNIAIRTVPTEESRRTLEALAGLADAKNTEAYIQMQETEIQYRNRFIVSLSNGFKEDEESRVQKELKDEELRLLLDRILTAYNDYLVRNYADVQLPDDAISIIDIQDQDVLDSLDQLRSGLNQLYAYCNEKTNTVKAYRSAQTGRSLTDWMETIRTYRSINVDYLYAMVSAEGITRDKETLLTGWKYLLREAQNELSEVNERIAETKKLLDAYKNDEVIISMQESDAAKTTKASTSYYNGLVLQQAADYETAADLKTTIADYTDRINRLDSLEQTEVTAAVEEELKRSYDGAVALYERISAHMEELFESPLYKTYEDHSAAQGKTQSFLTAASKKMIIGGVVGAVIGLGIWFMAALLPEFSGKKKAEADGKEAAK